ncbi:MAG: phosphoribosylglycinamide formyltransferase [Bacteriovoracaceae bacterium]|nr:phosphoribosylglycinamide formyltransferase [Bacteriovoracaceae bacterium]
MKRIAIMASGNGSNAESLITKAQELETKLNVVLVITDQPKAYVIERCKKHYIPCLIIEKKSDKSEHEKNILSVLKDFKIDWILLAGYMRILSPTFLKQYPKRVINIHPSLLPAFPGKSGYEDAFAANVTKSGVTIHYVDEGIDTGEIIMQESFNRMKDDTFSDFKNRGMNLEYKLYQQTLEWIANGKI